MTINEILELDFRDASARKLVQLELKKIKPLSKISGDVPLEKLEKTLYVLLENYAIFVQNIGCDNRSCDGFLLYNLSLVDLKDLHIIGKVWGISIYELFAKSVIFAYAITRKMNKRK